MKITRTELNDFLLAIRDSAAYDEMAEALVLELSTRGIITTL